MSVPTVRKIASRGQIPHYFVGTHMRFRPEAIQNYKQRLMGLEELLELDADSHALGDDDYLLDD